MTTSSGLPPQVGASPVSRTSADTGEPDGARAGHVSSRWTWRDFLGAVRVRCGLGRMHYRVRPGLYALGAPDPESPVCLSANYKLSFDLLRSSLPDTSAWLLVLDTRGINVWCAAGKGTFGTQELMRRIRAAGLAGIVRHRRVIAPQLGAPGIAAHEVKAATGFQVVYGPVRAGDLPEFLRRGLRASPAMRKVRFDLRDRAVLIPVEIAGGLKYFFTAALILGLTAGLSRAGFSWERCLAQGPAVAGVLALAVLAGSAVTPLLLPWLPGRAFALKGIWASLAVAVPAQLLWQAFGGGLRNLAGEGMMFVSAASFAAMNFTGATPYTSLSGVLKEMRLALPFQVAVFLGGLGLWLAARFA